MIQKLRLRFITAAMAALAIVLTIILGGINIVSYQKVLTDADAVLEILSNNSGRFPRPDRMEFPRETERGRLFLPKRIQSPEAPYENRFFTVTLNADGQPVQTDTANIAAIDRVSAAELAQQVAASGKTQGFAGDYRFRAEETCIYFVDCGRSLAAFRTTLGASLGIAAAGLLAVLGLLILFSGRIVRPVAESYEKQRRFITDAGHELKTPLTVIGADADLLALEVGEDNEWLADIRHQIRRLTELTGDLVYLARMDEQGSTLQVIEFPLSDLVEETVQSFQSLALQQGSRLQTEIQPMLAFTGNEKALRQLVSVLLDNAVKYSPEGSTITVALKREGKGVSFRTANPTREPISKERLSHLFERFYRLDDSRSTPGYGLGLSIARGIVTAHHGKIRADSPDGKTLCITVFFPEDRQGRSCTGSDVL